MGDRIRHRHTHPGRLEFTCIYFLLPLLLVLPGSLVYWVVVFTLREDLDAVLPISDLVSNLIGITQSCTVCIQDFLDSIKLTIKIKYGVVFSLCVYVP